MAPQKTNGGAPVFKPYSVSPTPDDPDEAGSQGSQWDSEDEDEDTSDSEDSTRRIHLDLLKSHATSDEIHEITTTPIFTAAVRNYAEDITDSDDPFTQYGLLAGYTSDNGEPIADPRVFYNVAAPSSVFICGSQGAGKSHTFSCLLENCLAKTDANVLPRPLTGIIFHYDTFISDTGGSPCEAAWLSSNPDIRVRVLCAPTNVQCIKKMYGRFSKIKVEELRLGQGDLNTKRMLDLMAVSSVAKMPLYLHVASRILRDMRVEQQRTNSGFNYSTFKMRLEAENLTKEQLAPLKQRLDTLESFMVEGHAKVYDMFSRDNKSKKPKKGGKTDRNAGTSWCPKPGQLTIVDLSCPCVTADMACSLFNVCLSLFLEQDAHVGRVVGLDEAHKYMSESAECQALTESLISTIRLQRHLGVRIFIATQEPTVSLKLLDLCSVTIVHRFTSPAWLDVLKKHLAGISSLRDPLEPAEQQDDNDDDNEDSGDTIGFYPASKDPGAEIFSMIVKLRTGQALIFAPSAILAAQDSATAPSGDARHSSENHRLRAKCLGRGVLRVRIRNRMTSDGGRSIMAV